MIIGICGEKRNGKDTIGDYLVSKYGFVKYSYADPIKYGCMAMFGFTHDQVFGDGKDVIDPTWGCTPRSVLQVMGTEIGQFDLAKYIPSFITIGRKIWVVRFNQWYKENMDKNVVICDLRFDHEQESIKNFNGEVWKVTNPRIISEDIHGSESGIKNIKYDKLILNDETINDLYRKIDLEITSLQETHL